MAKPDDLDRLPLPKGCLKRSSDLFGPAETCPCNRQVAVRGVGCLRAPWPTAYWARDKSLDQ
jgi:hypothetical protein